MGITDTIRFAAKNAARGGIKTALCVVAISVGICSVSTVLSMGKIATGAVASEIEQIGIGGIAFYPKEAGATVISNQDIEAVSAVDGVKAAMPLSIQVGSLWLKAQGCSVAVCGINHWLGHVFNVHLLHGRLPGRAEVSAGERVVVIDDAIAQRAYGRSNIVGKKAVLVLNGQQEEYLIIGVIQSQKQGLESIVGGEIPSIVYVPHTALEYENRQADKLAISCMAGYDEGTVAANVANILKNEKDTIFSHENLSKYTESLNNIAATLSGLVAGVAGISILVGGLGVMNSMISSIDSRIYEIGVFMSLGTTRRDIMRMFLIEAQIICLVGGLIGILGSCIIGGIVSGLLSTAPAMDIVQIILCAAGSAMCGIIFGALPAHRASRLKPIEAIRAE